MATFTKDHPFLCILSSHQFSELCAGWHHTPASPTLPPSSTKHSQFGSGKAGQASARQDMPPAGRIAAKPRGTPFPWAEEAESEVLPFNNPTQTLRSPIASLSSARTSWGLPPSLITACWQVTSPLRELFGRSTFTPTASRLSSPLGEGESSVAPSALSFPISPLVSHASRRLTCLAWS